MVGDQLVVAHERLGHGLGVGLPLGRRALDVRQQKRRDPRRERLAPAGAQPLHELAGGRGPALGVRRQPRPDRGLELLGLRRVDPVPGGQDARRRRAGEQRERRGGQRVDVAGARREPVAGELRRPEARRPAAAKDRVRRRGHPEVDELDAPALGQDQVGRLDVAVDDRRVERVQVRERLGGVGEVGEDARGCQAGAAALAQQRLEIGALHPVHRDHVAVALEEVLADERQPRVRWNGEQDARLREQVLAGLAVIDGADLQRDVAAVLAVERLHDTSLAADAERLEQLVALADQLHRALRSPTLRAWRTWT